MADDFTNRAYQFFLGKGYSQHAAAALAANAQWESKGNPTQLHDGGTGIGLFGWRDPKPGEGRKTALYKWAADNQKDPENEQTQLEFADHELQTDEKAAGDKIRAAKDYKEATDATLGYLRPLNYSDKDPGSSHGYTGRYNNGAELAGVPPIDVPPVGATQNVASTPGSSPAPYAPPAGLLTPPPAPASGTADLLAAQAAQQEATKKQAAYADLMKTGTGLLGQETPAAPFMQPAPIHRPQAQPTAMPDFNAILAQQRLMQRGGA